jgi:GTPase SAR1 family protein
MTIQDLIRPTEQIVVTGPAGVGKSTFIMRIVEALAGGFHPFTGAKVHPVRFLVLDPTIPADQLRLRWMDTKNHILIARPDMGPPVDTAGALILVREHAPDVVVLNGISLANAQGLYLREAFRKFGVASILEVQAPKGPVGDSAVVDAQSWLVGTDSVLTISPGPNGTRTISRELAARFNPAWPDTIEEFGVPVASPARYRVVIEAIVPASDVAEIEEFAQDLIKTWNTHGSVSGWKVAVNEVMPDPPTNEADHQCVFEQFPNGNKVVVNATGNPWLATEGGAYLGSYPYFCLGMTYGCLVCGKSYMVRADGLMVPYA